jgi:hypothetical protein
MTLLLCLNVVTNQTMLNHIFWNYKNILNISNVLILNIGLIRRLYGFSNIVGSIVEILILSVICVVMISVYHYVNQALMNLKTEMSNDASKVI